MRCNLGIGFVPREMLVAVPELTGVYPLTLDEPIAPRSILIQQKNQSLSIAAKHLRQMLLGDRSREVKKLPTQYGSCSQVHNVTYGAGRTVRGRK